MPEVLTQDQMDQLLKDIQPLNATNNAGDSESTIENKTDGALNEEDIMELLDGQTINDVLTKEEIDLMRKAMRENNIDDSPAAQSTTSMDSNNDVGLTTNEKEALKCLQSLVNLTVEVEARQSAEAIGIKLEDIDKIIAEYTEALKHSPDDDSVRDTLAVVYYIRGLDFTSKNDHDRAIADYSEAIKFESENILALQSRGEAYLASGDFDKAIADFEEIIQIMPNDNEVKNWLAIAYMKRGDAHYERKDYVRAISDYEKVLEFNPDDDNARELLVMTRKRLADKSKK